MSNNRTHMSPRIANTECRPKGFEYGFTWVTTQCLKNTVFCAYKAGRDGRAMSRNSPGVFLDPGGRRFFGHSENSRELWVEGRG